MASPKKKKLVTIQESKQIENHFDRNYDNLSPKKLPMSLSDRLSQSDHIKRIPKTSDHRSISSESSPTKKKRLQLIKEDGLWKIVEVEKSPIKTSKATVCKPLELMPIPNLYNHESTNKKKDPMKKKSCNQVATLNIDSLVIEDASKALSLVKESGWSTRTIDSPVKLKKRMIGLSCSTISPRKNKAIISKDFDINNENKEVSNIGWSSRTIDSPVKLKKKVIGSSCSTISPPQKNKAILSKEFDDKNRRKEVSIGIKNATHHIIHPKSLLTSNGAENLSNGLKSPKKQLGKSCEPTIQSPKKQIGKSCKNNLSPNKLASKTKKTTTTTTTSSKSPIKIPTKSPLVTCEKVKINVIHKRKRKVTFTDHRVVHIVPRVETPLKKTVFYTRADINRFREDQTKERYAEIERQFMEAFGSMMIPTLPMTTKSN